MADVACGVEMRKKAGPGSRVDGDEKGSVMEKRQFGAQAFRVEGSVTIGSYQLAGKHE